MNSYQTFYLHLQKIKKYRRVLSIFVTLFGFGMAALTFALHDISELLRWTGFASMFAMGLYGIFLFASSFRDVDRHPLLIDIKRNPKNIVKLRRYMAGSSRWCLSFHREQGRSIKFYGTESQVNAWASMIQHEFPHMSPSHE